jgi:CMP-N,N'-diacetyllegionaminic acid synthase
MIDGLGVLGVIAARGGSKGLPRKNILPVAGRPLIAWSIAAAGESRWLDRAIVSTDDAEIAEVARSWGGDVPFLRPGELATDEASVVDAVLQVADSIAGNHTYVVLLQATSPLRTGADIDAAIEICRGLRAPACVSVAPVSKGPWWMYTIDKYRRLRALPGFATQSQRRQELPAVFMPNGAVYVGELAWLRRSRSFYGERTVASEMPPERSVDIDSVVDLKLAEALISLRMQSDEVGG